MQPGLRPHHLFDFGAVEGKLGEHLVQILATELFFNILLELSLGIGLPVVR